MENKINNKYDVLTNDGFKDFIGVKRTYSDVVYDITLDNGLNIKSTKNHVYPTKDGFLSSFELFVGLTLQTKMGDSDIVKISLVEHNGYVYDLLEVADGNMYYANNVLTHNCSFLGSGDQVIDDKYVQRQKKENVKDPIRKEWIDGNMWIWEDPIKDHKYILAADAASGSSDDFGVMWILDFTTGNQVGEYRGKVTPDVLGEISHYYGEAYDAFIVVDITGGYGVSTVLKLLDLGYSTKKMYYDTVIGIDAVENNRSLEKYMRNGKLPGLNFQNKRNTLISEMEKSIRMNTIKVRSIRTVNEMSSFVFINNRPDHTKGDHDDCLMAVAMCNFVGMTSFKDLEKSRGQAKAMINGWATTTTTTESYEELNEAVSSGFYTDTGNNNTQTLNQTIEHSWLFSGFGQKRKR